MLDVLFKYLQKENLFVNEKIDYKKIIFKDNLFFMIILFVKIWFFCEGVSVVKKSFF